MDKLSIRMLIFWVLAIGCWATQSHAESREEKVIAAYIDATGGRAAHAAVRNYTYTAFFVVEDMNLRAQVQAWAVNPSTVTTQAYKQVVSIPKMGVVTQGLHKGSIWELHFLEGSSLLKGSQAREVLIQAELNPWVHWRNHYAEARWGGVVDGEEKVFFKSLIEGESDTVAYFDSETHLLNRLETMTGNQLPSTFIYDDYREVNGVLLSHHVRIEGELSVEIHYETFQFNVDLPKDVFTLPETITALIKASKIKKEVVSAAMVIEVMDTNKDGKINMNEAPPELQGSFQVIDTNRDGGIDVKEAEVIAQYINK